MDTYQYELVKKLSFLRFGGTDDEKKAARYLLEEIEKIGGRGETEEFSVPAYRFNRYAVRVTVPYEQELEVLPWGLSGGFPTGGADFRLFFAEDGSDAMLYGKSDLSDTAVLLEEWGLSQYKALCDRKAAAILLITGKWHDTGKDSFLQRHIRPAFLKYGKIPTFFVSAADAVKMIKNRAEYVHIELEQDELENISQNVIATVQGSEITDEAVLITAHYDSVNVGTGSWDNATGAATAMYIYKYFLAHPPKRTLYFVWCGSEEQGLLGSKAYVAAHSELIEKEIRCCFNFDMCGTVLGANKVCVTGKDEVKHYAEAFCREYGINAHVYQDVRSSDSASVADSGISTIDIIRRTKTTDIHTKYDLFDIVSAEQLKKDGDFAVAFIDRVVNSARLPFAREMSDAMKTKLDKYFLRDKEKKTV